MKEIQIDFSAPINMGDIELTTMGCRHTNPYICKIMKCSRFVLLHQRIINVKSLNVHGRKKYLQLLESEEIGNICKI